MSDSNCSSYENCIGNYFPKMEEPEVCIEIHDELLTNQVIDLNTHFTDNIPQETNVKTKRMQTEGSKRETSKLNRNSGKEYVSNTTEQNIRPERKLKPACSESCKLKCAEKFTENERENLFTMFWGLGDIEMQRQFIANCMKVINPKYRYVHTREDRRPRQKNNAFYFRLGDEEIRVCKTFFKNTLDINDRPIRTVLEKRHKIAGHLLEPDKRGKHGNHARLDAKLQEGIQQFINRLPRVKKGRNGKSFIATNKSIAALHKEYVSLCTEGNEPYSNYTNFYRIFTENNISSKRQIRKVKVGQSK